MTSLLCSRQLSAVLLQVRMASLDEVISGGEAEAIKRKRTAIQSMITVIRKSLERLLVKSDKGFDHGNIPYLRVIGEHSKLVDYHKKFDTIHEAYIQ